VFVNDEWLKWYVSAFHIWNGKVSDTLDASHVHLQFDKGNDNGETNSDEEHIQT
jgi:hypothetical protein